MMKEAKYTQKINSAGSSNDNMKVVLSATQ